MDKSIINLEELFNNLSIKNNEDFDKFITDFNNLDINNNLSISTNEVVDKLITDLSKIDLNNNKLLENYYSSNIYINKLLNIIRQMKYKAKCQEKLDIKYVSKFIY